jgi:hypothetical protein
MNLFKPSLALICQESIGPHSIQHSTNRISNVGLNTFAVLRSSVLFDDTQRSIAESVSPAIRSEAFVFHTYR